MADGVCVASKEVQLQHASQWTAGLFRRTGSRTPGHQCSVFRFLTSRAMRRAGCIMGVKAAAKRDQSPEDLMIPSLEIQLRRPLSLPQPINKIENSGDRVLVANCDASAEPSDCDSDLAGVLLCMLVCVQESPFTSRRQGVFIRQRAMYFLVRSARWRTVCASQRKRSGCSTHLNGLLIFPTDRQ